MFRAESLLDFRQMILDELCGMGYDHEKYVEDVKCAEKDYR